ncbi:MAG: hypothetical protein AAB445_04470 [Patescibacteria group bacterium]
METRDILNIVLAAVLLGVGGFTVWLLFYLVQIVKEIYKAIAEFRSMVDSVKSRLDHLGDFLDSIQTKVTSSASAIASVVRVVGDLTSMVKNKKTKRATPPADDLE